MWWLNVVFEWFHFLYLCPEGGFWVSFWGLLVALGTFFVIFEGIGGVLEVLMVFGSLGGPRLRQPAHCKV